MKKICLKNLLTHVFNGKLCYNLIADAIYWDDEFPPDEEEIPTKAEWAMRLVLNYRTRLLIGGDEELGLDFWLKAKSTFPDWVGFSAERCSKNSEVEKVYTRFKRKSSVKLAKEFPELR